MRNGLDCCLRWVVDLVSMSRWVNTSILLFGWYEMVKGGLIGGLWTAFVINYSSACWGVLCVENGQVWMWCT